jgi:CzcA family heavy metal efflux pump
MLNAIIAFSLKNRAVVLMAAAVAVLYAGYRVTQMRVDVLPDLNKPVVTIVSEAPGLAPEEVEPQVTSPIETALNGATGVQRVRSASGIGLSIVWVEFEWGADIHACRQIVTEKLQLVREQLPRGISPVMAPITSIMGEIMLLGMWSRGSADPMALRSFADEVVRPRLLSVPGVSQVSVIGGEVRQIHVAAKPELLLRHDVALQELTRAVGAASVTSGGGFIQGKNRELLVRVDGRIEAPEDLKEAVVADRRPTPVLVKHVAEVRFGSPVKRGDAGVNSAPAAILSIQKQPGADTVRLTAAIDQSLLEIRGALPADLEINSRLFRQEEFIGAAVRNVEESILIGAALVVVVLFIFLMNLRTSLINLTALPVSLALTALAFDALGLTINTMTLGGLAVAIGLLVDDSIVDVENVFRRLKENRSAPNPKPALVVVYLASSEVRTSIVYATLTVALAVLPLFFLPGVEGRLFAPVGIAFVISIFASLLVSLTVTPALASLLLPKAGSVAKQGDSFVLRWLKGVDRRVLEGSLRHPWLVMGAAVLVVAASVYFYRRTGKEFLPPFNEGSFTVDVSAEPGTPLAESVRLGTLAEGLIREVPEVEMTSRRTGRAEMDEHAEGVHYSEIDVRLKQGRSPSVVADDIRDRLAYMAGVSVNIGQPISHRIDHLMTGVRAQIALKVFGPDLGQLRQKTREILEQMSKVPGLVDLQMEAQVEIPQIRVRIISEKLASFGLTKAEVAEALETALQGKTVSQALRDERSLDVVVRLEGQVRDDPRAVGATMLATRSGAKIPLSDVADVFEATGPNTINRENGMRRIVISCNVAGRDLESVVAEIRAAQQKVALPSGVFVQYGGQFEARQAASTRITLVSAVAVAAMFLLLVRALGSWRGAAQCMANLPLAFAGGVAAVYFLGGGILSVASLVGFITLTGIVMRNGIMMISHYGHLMDHEGEGFDQAMIVRGSLERLAPVAMTAVTAILGLLPLAVGQGETGKEILHPLAVVVIGGMISSTLLDQAVTPALFFKFGRPSRRLRGGSAPLAVEVPPDLLRAANELEER